MAQSDSGPDKINNPESETKQEIINPDKLEFKEKVEGYVIKGKDVIRNNTQEDKNDPKQAS